MVDAWGRLTGGIDRRFTVARHRWPRFDHLWRAVDLYGAVLGGRLAAAINAAPGLHREARFPYHPHVTVAQDVAPEALDKAYEDLADFSAMFEVEAFTLFSHSGQTRWQPRRDFRLGG